MLRVRRRSACFDGCGCIEVESPEREVVPVTSQVGHGAVAEVPPTIPFGSREIDRMKWPMGSRANPQIPVE